MRRKTAKIALLASAIVALLASAIAFAASGPDEAGVNEGTGNGNRDTKHRHHRPPTPASETGTGNSSHGTGPCLLGSFGVGAWPGACWRPFSDSSPFNVPLPAHPRVDQDSSAVVSRIFSLASAPYPAELEARNDFSFGEPTYYSGPGDPAFTIHCTRTSFGRCALEGMSVRIPAGAKPEGGAASDGTDSGPDAHITVIDQAGNREYDLWQVQRSPIPSTGGTLNISFGDQTSITGSGIGEKSCATAACFANLAGRLRAEELQAGKKKKRKKKKKHHAQINHALVIDIKCDNGSYVYPATKTGARCSNTSGAPPMGARLQLDYTPREIAALDVPSWQKPILKAMAKYGMFFGDTGTANLFNIEVESDLQYTTMGSAPKWLNFAKANDWSFSPGAYGGYYSGKFTTGVDWHRLRVIDPCVTARTC
jgi:hypothetical protein